MALLLLGVSYATETNNDTSTDTSISTTTLVKDTTPTKVAYNTVKEANKTIIKDNKTTKTSSKTYNVNNFDTLHNVLTSSAYDTVTVNINSNIELTDYTELNSSIKTLKINGNGKTIDGNNNYRFLSIGSDTKVTIKNINIIYCNSEYGGAIKNKGNLTITNSTLNNNIAKSGGVIYNDGTLNLNSATLNNNKAICEYYDVYDMVYAGAIYNNGKCTIYNSNLSNNTATGDYMYFKAGGAIYNQGTITITKTTLNNNNAEYNGGAIYNNDKGIINIIKSTLNNNSASEWGGAISNFYGGTVTINNSTLNNNSASQWGGAIYNEGRLAINNTKLNYNNAEWSGGAIANEGGNCTINNTILNNNNADHGGAIFNYASTCSVINSVLNNNVPFVEVVEKNNIYNIKVIDSNGILFSQNSVLVYLNGVYDGNYTITDNLIRWNKELGNGKYLLSIVTNADNRINYNFKIGIKDTCISLNDIGYAQYSEDVVISGTLKDIDENPISNVSIKLSVNGKIVNAVTNRMGMFSYIFKATSIGLNGVIATYRGDERYSDSTNSTAFNVIPMTTRITLNKINTTKYNRNVTITGKFTDVKGKILGNSNLKVNINGKIYAIKTNTKGIYTFTKKAGNIGTNNVTVSYAGNTKYIGNTTKATFKVTKQNLKITVNAIKVTGYGSNVTITGKFMDATGKLLVNSIIRVNVNGKTYKVKSNSKGIFTKSIKTNKLGTNNVTISYPGNKNYNAISIKKTFKVVKNNVTVTITSAKQVGKTRNITITGKLTDKTGYILKNSQVTVKINDKTYYAKTNNNGVYTITKTAKKGTNNITVGYAGNKNYNKYTSTTKITIA